MRRPSSPPIFAIWLEERSVVGTFAYRSNEFQSIFERPSICSARTAKFVAPWWRLSIRGAGMRLFP